MSRARVTGNEADRPERVTKALNECAAAFIDCTLHSQDAIALVRYVLALEAQVRSTYSAQVSSPQQRQQRNEGAE